MIRTKKQYKDGMTIHNILQEHIKLEKIQEIFQIDDLRSIAAPTHKINILSLFSGCGGLDLGFELAGLAATIGEDEAMSAFADRNLYTELRKESIFHTIYTTSVA